MDTTFLVLPMILASAFVSLVAGPAAALDPCGPGHMRAEVRDGTLLLRWAGRVEQQMSADIAAEFDRYTSRVSTVSLSLNSCGGSLSYMERAIAVLEQIKGTHELATLVDRGALCGSACVPIFLIGTRRIGALTSSFFFHPVVVGGVVDPGTPKVEVRSHQRSQETEKIISRYFVGAGVSDGWLEYLRRTLRSSDLWQTGRDLWESKSGILTETMDNLEPRKDGPVDLPSDKPLCGLVCRG